MLNIEQIQEYLRHPDTVLEEVARGTGLSRMTIIRLKRGDGDASYRTVKAVSDYVERDDE